MRRFFSLGVLLHVLCGLAYAQVPAAPVWPRTNPPGVVRQRVGVTDIEVRYNRPSVKGREIFGALVPYGQVWRTGSDEATTVTFSTAATVGGAPIPAGTYELFTVPGRDQWIVIVHKHMSQWGSYRYDPANDVARVRVTPVTLASAVENFTVSIDDVTSRTSVLNLTWDRTRVPVLITVDTVGLTVPRIEAAMRADGRKPYFLAAMFYFENDLDLEQAAAWMAAALAESPGHIGMLYRQALILEKKGDREGAIAAARASLAGAATAARELREEYTSLNTALLARLLGRRGTQDVG